MDIRDRLRLRFVRRVVRTPRGRAHLLHQIADAESNGESQIFERVLSRVDDPQLRKMIEKHQADEVRHERLFRERALATGVAAAPIPPELHLIDRLGEVTGGLLTDGATVDRTLVMDAYLLLQVIEERAVRQFAIFEPAFRDVDPATADVFAEVARDEERHLKYCHAIARRYAPDEETRRATLARFRALEARAFVDNGRANLRYLLSRGLVEMGPLSRLFWRAATAASRPEPAYPVAAAA